MTAVGILWTAVVVVLVVIVLPRLMWDVLTMPIADLPMDEETR